MSESTDMMEYLVSFCCLCFKQFTHIFVEREIIQFVIVFILDTAYCSI
jgi:hypothetical protein